jgi:hypothetical protein
MVELQFNKDLLWESDWNGDEVGFPWVDVVGLYRLAGTSVYLYIDMSKNKILEAWEMIDDED